MNVVEVAHISKAFGPTQAVDDVSFSVEKGGLFGLLGPNGSGKTTTIRLILDIFKPDSGRISILGGPMTEEKKDRIGYMPEERGLYQDATLERCLLYLASLKGLAGGDVKKRLNDYFDRFDLAEHKNKKVKTLSKGMQQKAQIILTILHEPDIIIIDEPFTGLDPLNTRMIKDMIRRLRDRGTTIIMSTHQMHQVEELCSRIILIDRGRSILYGPLNDIRRKYSGHAILIETETKLPPVPGISEVFSENGAYRLVLQKETDPQSVLDYLRSEDIALTKFEIAVPTLEDIFVRAVEEEKNAV